MTFDTKPIITKIELGEIKVGINQQPTRRQSADFSDSRDIALCLLTQPMFCVYYTLFISALFLMNILKSVITMSCRTDSFLYFAYGSNLLTERIHVKNPSAVAVSAARLDGYALTFGHYSKVMIRLRPSRKFLEKFKIIFFSNFSRNYFREIRETR
jgi:hypothetical protein